MLSDNLIHLIKTSLSASFLLIIEENTTAYLEVLKQQLSILGYFVILDSTKFIDCELSNPPLKELIVVYSVASSRDASKLCQILITNLETQNLPIVFVFQSEKAYFKYIKPLQRPGFIDFIIKPFSFRELHQRIQVQLIIKQLTQKSQQQSKQLEVQTQKLINLSKGHLIKEMVAGFIHEVMQPLTAISNYTQTGKNLSKTHQQTNDQVIAELLEKIFIQIEFLKNLILRVKSFVKNPETFISSEDINQVILDVLPLIEINIKQHNTSIKLNLTKNISCVAIDKPQVQQVLLNLICNAIESMSQLSTNKTIYIQTKQLNKLFVQVSVIDTGIGIVKALRRKIFLPFYSSKSDGLGIGLTVCHAIIKAHGGCLNFKKNPKGGIIFEFTLPVLIPLQ